VTDAEQETDMISLEEAQRIDCPESKWQEILEHCKRKLAGHYLSGESRMPRAYGLVAGVQHGPALEVERILPIKKNVRDHEPYKPYMDRVMEQYAVPSKTPFSQRGWMTDPTELKACYEECDQEGLMVFGTYHMHVIPWKHDPLRDTPTQLDRVLARNSQLFTFIVSMVNVALPRIRAFYEALEAREVPILIQGRELSQTA
jgi:proteasome lid subunit RPN8/RPN11